MANAFYNAALQDIPNGATPWSTGSIKATLVGSGYTYSATHSTLADLGGNQLSGCTPQALTGNAVSTAGVATANSITFSGVTASQALEAIVLYIDLGGGSTRLIAYFDTGAGLPLTTTGADITVDWNATPGNGTVFTAS